MKLLTLEEACKAIMEGREVIVLFEDHSYSVEDIRCIKGYPDDGIAPGWWVRSMQYAYLMELDECSLILKEK